MVLLIQELIGQSFKLNMGIICKESQFTIPCIGIQCSFPLGQLNFATQPFFSIPPSFVRSVVVFDIIYLGVVLSIGKN